MNERMVVSVRATRPSPHVIAVSADALSAGLRARLGDSYEQVTSPEQHSRWGKAYINFLVRTEPQQYRVRRRYRCACQLVPCCLIS